ncbi:SDR family NAD(P)-dependent oxidoreductase [Couchioplanes azureus]|uniref:SDR family NAD(P)-dependent oxidoreductase n=1 Tax=Couchioplanes caeruleus TaxID=56438 RepID=UPI00166F675F|nr:SDR family NAD(P)-dependent oxidoreductase [Couchioplanes caeruleus]GGQ81792.1 short-chain dehydrogenase [Couchioplanes caeruleus subsp. azureus]
MSEQVEKGRAVLVSGASTGLGRACARHLDHLGFQVFAGVRREADAEALRAASSPRLSPVLLDVTREESVAQAVALVSAQVGAHGLWGLVNNAGICVSAPLECVSADQLRHQLETNLIGHHAVIRASLPLVRMAHGRIVNVSSGLGRIASPYLGAYAASQFAKEGYSDALRRELRPFGVGVSVVQPGAIRTPIWEKVSEVGHRTLDGAPAEVAELYRACFLRFLAANDRRARASATRPEAFADAVAHALTARRPKSRYRVGRDSRLTSVLSRVLPDRVLDAAFATIVGDRRLATGSSGYQGAHV